MNAKEYLESKGFFGLDTKKRYNEVIEWMEDYAKERVKNCSIPDVVERSEQLSLSSGGCYECPKCGKSLHVSDYEHDCKA